MRPISPGFRAAIRNGYTIASQAQILDDGLSVGDPIPLMAATVNSDRTSAQRTQFSASVGLSDLSLIPTDLSSLLGPGGNELKLSSGWVDNGVPEYVPLGIFPITTVVVGDTGNDLTITLSGYDRSWTVSQLKFKAPYVVAAGLDLGTAIVALVASVYPSVTSSIIPTAGIATPAANFKEGDDPWAAALTLAASGGYDLFFDSSGVLVGRPTPDPTTLGSLWTYADSGGDAAPKAVVRTLTRDGISNDFTVTGSGTNVQPPVQAKSSDTDPNSPTYTGGPFGDVPTFISSSLVTTTTAAQNAALNALHQSLGSVEKLVLTALPAPMFEVDDVITVTRPRIHVSSSYVIDAVSTTLRHDGVTQLTLRKV